MITSKEKIKNHLNNKLITIIIPLFNDEQVIDRLFRYNICKIKDKKNIEFIFIDDCSKDKTLEMLNKNLNITKINFKVIKNAINSGPSFSRNQGIKVSEGEFIAFLDSDDLWHPNKLDTQLSILDKSNADLCATEHDFIDIEKIQKFQTLDRNSEANFEIIRLTKFIFKTQFVLPSVVARKNIFINNFFNENLRYGEDFDFWLRLLLKNKIIIRVNCRLTAIVKRDNLKNLDGLSDNQTKMFTNLSKILINQFFVSPILIKPIFLLAIFFMQIRFFKRVIERVFKLVNINIIWN